MPNIVRVLPEVDQSVFRPVCFAVVQAVMDVTGIDPNTRILFPGDTKAVAIPGSTLSDRDQLEVNFETQSRVEVEIEEKYDTESWATTIVSTDNHIPVFIDEKLDVVVRPIYVQDEITIKISYKSQSKTEVKRWRDQMRIRTSMRREVDIQKVQYHYSMPAEYIDIITEIHRLRELVAPYGDTFIDYFKKHSTDRIAYIATEKGTHPMPVVAETQGNIHGYFDWDVVPDEPTFDDRTGIWSLDFTYKFTFEKPIACNMVYPIQVHNQLIPEEYIQGLRYDYDHARDTKMFNRLDHAMFCFQAGSIMQSMMDIEPFIRVPEFDDWVINRVMPGSGTFMTILTTVEDDGRTLCNLRDLGDVYLDEELLKFLEAGERTEVTREYRSLINVSLYTNGKWDNADMLEITPNLDVKAKIDLDRRNTYRVRLSLMVAMDMVPWQAISRVFERPKLMEKLIVAMNKVIHNHPDFTRAFRHTKIRPHEFLPVYQILTGSRPMMAGGASTVTDQYLRDTFKDIPEDVRRVIRDHRVRTKTVMVSSILASKRQPA